MPPNGGIPSLVSALRPAATTKSLQLALDTILGVTKLAVDSPTDQFKRVASALLSDLDELYASCPKQVISVVTAIFAHCFDALLLPALEGAQPTEKFESILRGVLGGAVEAAKVDSVTAKFVACSLFKHVINLLEARFATQLGVSMLRDAAAFFEDICGEHRCYDIILEQKLISATRFGKLLVNHNLFFCLQALLDLLPQLLPSSKERRKRQDFIKNTFNSPTARDLIPPNRRKDVIQLIMDANAQEWPKVARQLFAAMAEANPSKPQPFAASNLTIDGSTFSHGREIIVYFDQSGLVSNIQDEAGDFEDLEIPYKSIIGAHPYPFRGSVTLTLKNPPALSATEMRLANSPPHKLVLDIKSEDQHRFFQLISEHGLISHSASYVASTTASSPGQRRFSLSQGVPFDAAILSQADIKQIKLTELQAMHTSSPTPAAPQHTERPAALDCSVPPSPLERMSPKRKDSTASAVSELSELDVDAANQLLPYVEAMSNQNSCQTDSPPEPELKSRLNSTHENKIMPAAATKRANVTAEHPAAAKPTMATMSLATVPAAPIFVSGTPSSRKRKMPESDDEPDLVGTATSRTAKRARKVLRVVESSTEDDMDNNSNEQAKGDALGEKTTAPRSEAVIYNSQFLHESSSPAKMRYGRSKARTGAGGAKRSSRKRKSVDYDELPGGTNAKATVEPRLLMTVRSPRTDALQKEAEFEPPIGYKAVATKAMTVKEKAVAVRGKARKVEATKKHQVEQASPTSEGDETGGPVKEPPARRAKTGKAKKEKPSVSELQESNPPQQDKPKTRAATKKAAALVRPIEDELPWDTSAAGAELVYDQLPAADMEVAEEPVSIASNNDSYQAREDAAIAADFKRFINFSPTVTDKPHDSSPRAIPTVASSSKPTTTPVSRTRKVKKSKKAPWDAPEWAPDATTSSNVPVVGAPSSDAVLIAAKPSVVNKPATTEREGDTSGVLAAAPTSMLSKPSSTSTRVEQPMVPASAKLLSTSAAASTSPKPSALSDASHVSLASSFAGSSTTKTHDAPQQAAAETHPIANFASSSDAFCVTPPRSNQSLNLRSRALPEVLNAVAPPQASSSHNTMVIRSASPVLASDLPPPASPVEKPQSPAEPVRRAHSIPSVAVPPIEPVSAEDSDVEIVPAPRFTRSQRKNVVRSPPAPVSAWSEASTLLQDVSSPPPRRDNDRVEEDVVMQDPLVVQLPSPSAGMKNKLPSAMKSPRSMLKPSPRTVKFAIDAAQEEAESSRLLPHAPRGGLLSPLHVVQSDASAARRKSPLARRDHSDDEDTCSPGVKDKHLGKILSVLDEMHQIITSRIASNFEQIDVGPVEKQRELFADVTKDIGIMRDESAAQFKVFVGLEKQYTGFGAAHGSRWQELIKVDVKLLKTTAKAIQHHDSHSIMKEMPKSLFPGALPKCFAV